VDGFSPDNEGDIWEKFHANVEAFGIQHHIKLGAIHSLALR
jgi:hypothetical protein